MNRAELEHVIRAAAANADTDQIIVIGSQSLLGTYPELDHPLLCASMEADVFPKENPGRSILIDGAIGERSVFHETFGYYAHGVAPETAVLPAGWEERLVPVRNENTRWCTGWCLDPHDMAVGKLVAGREKDIAFLGAMRQLGLLDKALLTERLDSTEIRPTTLAELVKSRLRNLWS